jgi:hypothetical protein
MGLESSWPPRQIKSKPASVAAAPPRGYPDLHDHIRALDKAGLLVTVDQPTTRRRVSRQ